jgi:hypothetical protein
MSMLFLRDEVGDCLAVIEEITQAVKDLCFGEIQGVGDFQDGFAAQVEGGDMAHGDAQAVNERFPAAHTVTVHDMRMLGFEKCFHGDRVGTRRKNKGSGQPLRADQAST